MSQINEFSLMIEKKALEESRDLGDVLLEIVTEKGIDPAQAAPMLNATLKEKLRIEYQTKGYKLG